MQTGNIKSGALAEYLHLFEVNDRAFAASIITGDVFEIDNEAHEFLKRDLNRSLDELESGHDVPVEVQAVLGDVAPRRWGDLLARAGEAQKQLIEGESGHPITTADIHVTNDCNLRCRYCYGLDCDDYVAGGQNMDDATGRAVVDFLFASAPPNGPVTFVFFGGEPLLNLDLIRKMVAYAEEKSEATGVAVSFSITTNGTLLNMEAIRFLNEKNFGVMVSVDGPAEMHDKMRVFKNGRGSSGRMFPKLEKFLSSRKGRASSRATISSTNTDLVAVAMHAKQLGFSKSVVGLETDIVKHDFKADLVEYRKQLVRLADFMVSSFVAGDPVLVEPFETVLQSIVFETARKLPCAAGRRYVAVSPEGQLYPCHRFMGNSEYLVGDVWSGLRADMVERFSTNSVWTKESCMKCVASRYCAGGCPHTQAVNAGGIENQDEDNCTMTRDLFEVCVYLASRLEEAAGDNYRKWVDFSRQRLDRTPAAGSQNQELTL